MRVAGFIALEAVATSQVHLDATVLPRTWLPMPPIWSNIVRNWATKSSS